MNAGKKADNSNTSSSNQSNSRKNQDAPGKKQLERELRLERFDWDSFKVADALGEGRSGRGNEGQQLSAVSKGKNVSATAVREHGQKGVVDDSVVEGDKEEAKGTGAGSVPVPTMDETGDESDQHEEGDTLRGEKVVVKLCDLWQHPGYHEEMLMEVSTYLALEKLQGHVIPKLKGTGYTAGGLSALKTEFGGSPIEVENLNDEMRKKIIRALERIYMERLLHRDISRENILIEHCCHGFRIMFIYFGLSKKSSDYLQGIQKRAGLAKENAWLPLN